MKIVERKTISVAAGSLQMQARAGAPPVKPNIRKAPIDRELCLEMHAAFDIHNI